MDLFNLLARITLDKSAYEKGLGEAEKGTKSFGDRLKSGLGAAAKAVAAGMAVASGAIIKLSKDAIESYAEYEQLVGGVQTLFGTGGKSLQKYAESVGKSTEAAKAEYEKLEKAQSIVLDNASKAYKNAGLSQNAYMETVTSFSASLISSLGGDTVKAAKAADAAIVAMSDNANKMGTSMESIQNAYNGFAKQNYTMLDNLKLGYGGTKEEMARLISDAAKMTDVQKKLGVTVDEGNMSFANIANAIQVVQTKMGIAGTTADEAASTISGSFGMLKGAWENLKTGLSDSNADIGALVSNVIESGQTVAANLIPRINQVLTGITSAISGLAPQIVQIIPGLVQDILPGLTEGAMALVQEFANILPGVVQTVLDFAPKFLSSGIDMILAIGTGFSEALPQLLTSAVDTIVKLVDKFIENLPQFIEVAIQIIVALANGIQENLPKIIAILPKVIMALVNGLMQLLPELVPVAIQLIITLINGVQQMLPELIPLAIQIIFALIGGLLDMLPDLLTAGTQILFGIIDGIIDNLPQILLEVPRIITTIIAGLIDALPKLIAFMPKIIMAIVNAFRETDWSKLGGDLLEGLWNGIKDMGEWLKEKIRGLGSAITDALKAVFGIHSPSTVFRDEIGENLALGLGEGFEDEMANVEKRMQKAIPTDFDIAANVKGGVSGATTTNSAVATVIQAMMPELYSVIVQALQDGVKIQWKERELARLVKTYAN